MKGGLRHGVRHATFLAMRQVVDRFRVSSGPRASAITPRPVYAHPAAPAQARGTGVVPCSGKVRLAKGDRNHDCMPRSASMRWAPIWSLRNRPGQKAAEAMGAERRRRYPR